MIGNSSLQKYSGWLAGCAITSVRQGQQWRQFYGSISHLVIWCGNDGTSDRQLQGPPDPRIGQSGTRILMSRKLRVTTRSTVILVGETFKNKYMKHAGDFPESAYYKFWLIFFLDSMLAICDNKNIFVTCHFRDASLGSDWHGHRRWWEKIE